MVEVPEYLLRRSRERREALGLAPTGAPPTEAAGDSPGGGTSAPAEAAPAAPAAAAPPSPAEAPAPDTTPAAEELPPYLGPTGPRSGIPAWAMPVLVLLPLWAIVYLGAFGSTGSATQSPLQQGAAVFQKAGCGGCHGPQGQGAVGPKLAGGEAKLTFPNEADHIAWVETGSQAKKGQPYGDAGRPGGQHTASAGIMPGFKGQLSDAEIKAVVTYERDGL